MGESFSGDLQLWCSFDFALKPQKRMCSKDDEPPTLLASWFDFSLSNYWEHNWLKPLPQSMTWTLLATSFGDWLQIRPQESRGWFKELGMLGEGTQRQSHDAGQAPAVS